MSEHRRENRDSLFLLAAMRLVDRVDGLRVKVRNLSASGMMAESPVRAARGDRLTIDLRNIGWVTGTVAWVAENRFGVVFDQEIDARAVRQPITIASDLPDNCIRRPSLAVIEPPPEPDPANLRMI